MKNVYCECTQGRLEGTSKLHADVAHIPVVPALNTFLFLSESETMTLCRLFYVQLTVDQVKHVWAWHTDESVWYLASLETWSPML